jgi:uncharacterized short protein YbdD (DUF466 family)
MTERLVVRLGQIARSMRAIIGVPDYERYVAHMKQNHPDCDVVPVEQFLKERMENRYSKPGTRCC